MRSNFPYNANRTEELDVDTTGVTITLNSVGPYAEYREFLFDNRDNTNTLLVLINGMTLNLPAGTFVGLSVAEILHFTLKAASGTVRVYYIAQGYKKVS